MATLMYEVLLTRIFSVTTWYHFAFLSISVTITGLAAGGIAVYLHPLFFREDRTHQQMAAFSAGFAVFASLAILVHLFFPYLLGAANAAIIMVATLVLTIPFTIAAFTASGIVISLCLTRFPKNVAALYAADLVGAALGCLALVGALRIMDGVSCVFLVSTIAAIAGALFLCDSAEENRKLQLVTLSCFIGFGALTLVQALSYRNQHPVINIGWTKGLKEAPNLYHLWNSFSRVRVFGDGEVLSPADPYGLSSHVDGIQAKFLYLDIDGGAATPILKFGGDAKAVDHLRYEISNAAHYIRPESETAVVGAGGGKDLLSALIFGDKHVTAIDINENILNTVHNHFADYSGNLRSNPKVTLINDEARSYITRTDSKFDIIQVSMIDTWAATASGAYTLSENGLYTVESFKILLNHLKPHGVLTVSRWYAHGIPSEFYRLVSLSAYTLKLQSKDPAAHIIVLRNMPKKENMIPDGVGTLLLSPDPFSEEDYRKIEKYASEMDFEIIYDLNISKDPILTALAKGENPARAAASVPFNLQAPTDDSPFFFQPISLAHLTDPQAFARNMNISNIMAGLLLLVAGLATFVITVYCIRIPYLQSSDHELIKKSKNLFFYFFSIGAGFMFVEMSQIERLTIFLGHPVYGLSVVLFALLLSTGIGSVLSEIWFSKSKAPAFSAPAAILAMLVLYAIVSGGILEAAVGYQVVGRILTAVALLFPLGLALGSGFPAGMRVASKQAPSLTPWLWGINGAASVWISVLAIIVAMLSGIQLSYFCGLAFYIGAFISMWLACKQEQK